MGYTNIFTAENGVEAVDILKQQGSEICLVISDMAMPEKDGIGLMTQMFRICTEPTALIFCSGKVNGFFFKAKYKFAKKNVFVVDYFEKPGDMKKMVESISLHLADTLLKREQQPYESDESTQFVSSVVSNTSNSSLMKSAPQQPIQKRNEGSLETYLKHVILLLVLGILVYLVVALQSFHTLPQTLPGGVPQQLPSSSNSPQEQIPQELLKKFKQSSSYSN
jgi:YesN/AraC family two-component response regulator